MQFDIAIRASQGARRAQEDTALAWPGGDASDDSATLLILPDAKPSQAAAVLCDGMGGHIGGAMASRTACVNFLPALLAAEGSVRERLLHALEQANIGITDPTRVETLYNQLREVNVLTADLDFKAAYTNDYVP